MKTKDLLFGGIIILCFLPFFISESFYNGYTEYNGSHPYIMAFFKFAILATLGEVIGLRIKKGIYNEPGFGILPRAIIWGFLGMWIAVAMKTFSSGVPYPKFRNRRRPRCYEAEFVNGKSIRCVFYQRHDEYDIRACIYDPT